MAIQPVLIGGEWRQSKSSGTFQAENPALKSKLPEEYPISSWADVEAALDAAMQAAAVMRTMQPEQLAKFLDAFAAGIEVRAEALVEIANIETALAKKPRLADAELPRTCNQLRQAAAAVREGTWQMATIDTKSNIRSHLAAIGPVWVFGPNNFPYAYNGVGGGDFASAIASGNPVIGKANTSHPGTTRLLAEIAHKASVDTGMPAATVQMIYRTSHEDGLRLVSDHRTAGIGYTGSREAGLKLKTAADAAGKPVYLELSSINPVVLLPGAMNERADKLAEEFTGSCLMGAGQFCTNPGLILMLAGEATERFLADVAKRFAAAPVNTMLSGRAAKALEESYQALTVAGAERLVGGTSGGGAGYSFGNTLLRVSAAQFLKKPQELQREAFGNLSLCVVAESVDQLSQVLDQLEGNLTGSIYSHTAGEDDAIYNRLVGTLRSKVGRLLNDKMPTGVAVVPSMNHGGPFPATGHAGFTAVGVPAAMHRFAALHCYDNVRPQRLPPSLQDKCPTPNMWRFIDGTWVKG